MMIALLQSEGESPYIQILLNIFINSKCCKGDNIFHLVLLKYQIERPATPPQRRAYCIPEHFQMKS